MATNTIRLHRVLRTWPDRKLGNRLLDRGVCCP